MKKLLYLLFLPLLNALALAQSRPAPIIPQLYVDVGVISFAIPRPAFHHYLHRIVEAGFGNRVMFGSDQMVWPEAIEVAIDSIETADFLSREQKRDILYNNAARFLRLTPAQLARHHAQ